jgi:hypothetical protein
MAVGVALGRSIPGGVQVDEVRCPGERTAVEIVTEWLREVKGPSLIAMDAPLGWPSTMGPCLTSHRAGRAIDVPPNALFRRETDRFVCRELGKMPLDVGADRIARTAHAALRVLENLRKSLDAPIPLAWSGDAMSGPAAIEVYPAATLIAHSLSCTGYKKAKEVEARRSLVACLRNVMALPTNLAVCDDSADALDAIVCILAAADFVNGRAMPPEDRQLAEREGWIWVASKKATDRS